MFFLLTATVMPHGLFLGSHLATVDRLDTAPVPPQDRAEKEGLITVFNRIRANGLPKQDWSSVLPAKWRQRQADRTPHMEAETDTEDRELTKEEQEADAKWEHERVRYEAEVKAFDRVKYVTVSIAHSTVSNEVDPAWRAVLNSTPLVTLDRHDTLASRVRCHYQQRHLDPSLGSLLLRRK
jgi:hypothetical protein